MSDIAVGGGVFCIYDLPSSALTARDLMTFTTTPPHDMDYGTLRLQRQCLTRILPESGLHSTCNAC